MAAHDTGERDDLTAIVDAARQGSRSAFDEIVRRTYVDTYTLAVRLTGNEEDARDVVQDAYLRAWKGIRRFRGDAQVTTWLYRITANASFTHVKKRQRLRTVPLEDVDEPVEARLELQPDASVEAAAGLAALSDAVRALPATLRGVLVLKDVYGLSHEEIAEELGISETAAKVRLHRARKKLRDVLYGGAVGTREPAPDTPGRAADAL